jgi:hypothetical protein
MAYILTLLVKSCGGKGLIEEDLFKNERCPILEKIQGNLHSKCLPGKDLKLAFYYQLYPLDVAKCQHRMASSNIKI